MPELLHSLTTTIDEGGCIDVYTVVFVVNI
jgi:hypothetical protein